MNNQFHKFIKKNNLFSKNDKVLIAVSGGIDSIVMLDLFAKTKLEIAIVHCNFQLRSDESMEDEKFVRSLSKKYKLQFFVKKFDTKKYASSQKISIQMAARELRYNWFEKIRKEICFDYISIAHNKDDIVETFFLNLIRGTGIRGLTGINAKNDKIVRPLLFADRKMIDSYRLENQLPFREDSSNKSIKYKRNKIRHQILPLFNELNPAFSDTILENIEKLAATEKIYATAIEDVKNKVISHSENQIKISLNELQKHKPYKTFLYELIYKFGFTQENVADICKSIGYVSGRQFFTKSHRIIIDREFLIITEKKTISYEEFQINSETKEISVPISLKLGLNPSISSDKIKKNTEIAYLDFDTLKFPLKIRKWEKGDRFFPLGMKKSKKLSDFFIDQKFSILEKENQWILTSEDKIVWIIGKRIDNRFKISEKTKKVLIIKS